MKASRPCVWLLTSLMILLLFKETEAQWKPQGRFGKRYDTTKGRMWGVRRGAGTMSRSIHVNDRGKGPTIKNLDVPFFKTDNTYCLRLGRPGLYKCVRLTVKPEDV